MQCCISTGIMIVFVRAKPSIELLRNLGKATAIAMTVDMRIAPIILCHGQQTGKVLQYIDGIMTLTRAGERATLQYTDQ